MRVHWHWQMWSSLSCAQLRQSPNRFQIWQWQLPPSKWLASALSGRPVCRERHKSDLDTNKWIVKKKKFLRTGYISLTVSQWQCYVHTKKHTYIHAYKHTRIHTDRQTDRQACKLHLLSNLDRVAFLLPNVTNSNNQRELEQTDKFIAFDVKKTHTNRVIPAGLCPAIFRDTRDFRVWTPFWTGFVAHIASV